jgi:hypothetical protein
MARDKGANRRKSKYHKDLLTVARRIRDAFNYNPGHSDLDREQPIHIRVTLGDWRDLNYLVTALDMYQEPNEKKGVDFNASEEAS